MELWRGIYLDIIGFSQQTWWYTGYYTMGWGYNPYNHGIYPKKIGFHGIYPYKPGDDDDDDEDELMNLWIYESMNRRIDESMNWWFDNDDDDDGDDDEDEDDDDDESLRWVDPIHTKSGVLGGKKVLSAYKEKVEKESMAVFVGISAPSGMIQKNKRIQ